MTPETTLGWPRKQGTCTGWKETSPIGRTACLAACPPFKSWAVNHFSAPQKVWRAVQKTIPNGSGYGVHGDVFGLHSWALSWAFFIGCPCCWPWIWAVVCECVVPRGRARHQGSSHCNHAWGCGRRHFGVSWQGVGGTGVAAFFAALHIHSNHFQMTYYLLFLLVAIALGAGWKAFREKAWPQFSRRPACLPWAR